MGENCCKNGGSGRGDSLSSEDQDGGGDTNTGYDPTQEPIFPPELKVRINYNYY